MTDGRRDIVGAHLERIDELIAAVRQLDLPTDLPTLRRHLESIQRNVQALKTEWRRRGVDVLDDERPYRRRGTR